MTYPYRIPHPSSIYILRIRCKRSKRWRSPGVGGSTVIGPLLVGLNKPVQIVSLNAKDSDIASMTAAIAARPAIFMINHFRNRYTSASASAAGNSFSERTPLASRSSAMMLSSCAAAIDCLAVT
ncbi:phosphate acyltransferase [Mesorhizobium sp. LMG 17147]|nr:phosphate acyltransferase [Mesorhizobium sp. LMG 17147]MCP9229142.1 phosphate acyltransferase [Mesorhizobium sp. LMG 17147]